MGGDRQQLGDRPDLILMDVQMPVMDGLEAIAQIRLDIRMDSRLRENDREMTLSMEHPIG